MEESELKNKKKKYMKVIVYLSVEGDVKKIPWKEEKQLHYIKEYAKAHNIEIVQVVHRDIRGAMLLNNQYGEMIEMVKEGMAEGILIAKSACIATNIMDVYKKAAMAAQAGGKLITVKEGILNMPVKMVG
jgi:DNA invertase Pin-like site-specific DNA recombinase